MIKLKQFFFITGAFFCLNAKAQTVSRTFKINDHTILVDSAGNKINRKDLGPMLETGEYGMKRINPENDSAGYLIYKMGGDVKLRKKQIQRAKGEIIASMPKPAESHFFITGEKVKSFMVHDIDGNKFKLKDLEGKVVVINFWFIGCPPCRMEMPDLNELALSYKDDPNVVFIAIALDLKDDIRKFISVHPLAYHIVEDGRVYAELYRLNLYPTNVVLDKEGKVRFHSTSYYPNNAYWIKKTIDESK